MKRKSNHIHRGQILQAAVEATRLNKDDVAEKAGYKRSSYYKHIKEPDLPYHILAAYGAAIKYDFTEELPEMPKYIIEGPAESYNTELTLEEAKKQIDLWKNKYIDLLERYNTLIEEMRNRK